MAYRVTDIECYKNYFLLLALDPSNGTVYRWERHDDKERGRSHDELRRLLKDHMVVTFNGLGYDWWMLSAYLDGYNNTELKALSDWMIKTHMSQWKVTQEKNLESHPGRHLDLMPVAPLVASLKIYAGRLHAPKLQDLPVPITAHITEELRDEIVPYCVNDLICTSLLHCKLKPQILLRHRMGQKYRMSLTSKSDPQIAEAVIKKLLAQKNIRATRHQPTQKFYKFDKPACIKMRSTDMIDVEMALANAEFKLSSKGSLLCPAEFRKPIDFGQNRYKMGIGGLHSNEKCRSIRIQGDQRLTDLDVTSYYPRLILSNRWYPEHLGEKFLDVYASLVNDRIKAKVDGDNVTAEALKIVINSSFGKFGNKYSALYSPKLLMQTTFSGQLYLFMLIEMIELRTSCRVVSANTDGITVFSPTTVQYERMLSISQEWEELTQMQLEGVQYRAIFSQDVNNYLAIKTDKTTKRKGVFAKDSLSKNPTFPIIQKAAIQYLTEKTPIRTTIEQCEDIRAFCALRKVTGGAVFRDNVVGATVRWYVSVKGSPVLYLKQNQYDKHNKVPMAENAHVVNDLPEQFPDDVDYQFYWRKADELIDAVGAYREYKP